MRVAKKHLQLATQMVDRYCRYNPSSLSLQNFIDHGAGGSQASEKTAYLFLRKEVPVRLANIMKEINLLPEQLLDTKSASLVIGWYKQSFEEVLQFEKASPDDSRNLENFVDTLTTIRNRHSAVVETMAHGILEMQECMSADENHSVANQIQYFLDRFYINRISIRMLINQHTLLFGNRADSVSRHIGCIDLNCNVNEVAQDAYQNAKFLCDQYYMTSPGVELICTNCGTDTGSIQMVYVPSHLYHILFELIKNAMRAVVEHHGIDCEDLPKIKVHICRGNEDVSIKISDQGGGVSRHQMELLFNYMYSTAPKPDLAYNDTSTPLAGYGYGLPLSRLYAKYFNGDLELSSMEGYGTDAIIYLKVFPSEANELIPIYNKTSYKHLTSSIPVGDWSNPAQTTGLHSAYNGTRSFHNTSYRHYSRQTWPQSKLHSKSSQKF